jgi:hypothetical protein
MIPPLNEYECLPEGIHDGTMEEAAGRFGVFQTTDRRLQLWAKFTEFMRELKACDFIEAVLVDGSFVTGTAEPNDIDLVLVVESNYDLSTDLPPVAYNLLAHHRVQRRFGFDIVVVKMTAKISNKQLRSFSKLSNGPT